MSDNPNEDILDQLAADLQANPPSQGSGQQVSLSSTPPIALSNTDMIEKYVNDSAQKSNDILMQVMQRFAIDIQDDPERASAFSQLIKSNTEILKLLNDQVIKSKDNQTKITIQKMKEQGNILKDTLERDASVISNRDMIFKEILNTAKEAVIETEDN